MKKLIALLALLPFIATASPCPHPHRSTTAKRQFVKLHACPATDKHATHCTGYVIDHIVPLCACGLDAPQNMQWQSVAEAKKKDVLERRQCSAKSK